MDGALFGQAVRPIPRRTVIASEPGVEGRIRGEEVFLPSHIARSSSRIARGSAATVR